MNVKRKLIEVALPLESINTESAREKSIRQGHPSTLHLWWARRPLAACRAVLFASLVDDPSSRPEEFPTEADQDVERKRLFGLIEELVRWENSMDQRILSEARDEILRSTEGKPPPVLDPFCGGGSIPLEAQRLGLEAYASDLNPVAVLITKALIEIPPRFARQPPVNPKSRASTLYSGSWPGAKGLAEDVRYYGRWARDEAERRIGHLYPKAKLPTGRETPVIAWIWARTVRCPNPACGAQMPLASTFALATKAGRKAWLEPVVDQAAKTVSFEVRTHGSGPPDSPKVGRGAKFRCLVCGQVAEEVHIRRESQAGRMGAQLIAIVAQSQRGRMYLAPSAEHEEAARVALPTWSPDQPLPGNARWFSPPIYGMTTYANLFTARQCVLLSTLTGLIGEVRERVRKDAIAAGYSDEKEGLRSEGRGAVAYADAITVYLGLGIGRLADNNSTLVTWSNSRDQIVHTFGRQALPMTWDYAEVNPFAGFAGDLSVSLDSITKVVSAVPASTGGTVNQLDARSLGVEQIGLVCTDPPYYDNIGYADLADYFYVWLRPALDEVFPQLFSTLLTPKTQELVATPYRFGGSLEQAKAFFEDGLAESFAWMREVHDPRFPLTIFYAFKESANSGDGLVASTGWETMLEALVRANLTVHGTWPIRSERVIGMKQKVNALASSIVLACRPRSPEASVTTRREFLNSLRSELPGALRLLQRGNIAPVDLAQAAIGPGMEVFSRYAKVVEATGDRMPVRIALGLINQVLDEVLTEQESDFDGATRFAIAWFETHGLEKGSYGEAQVLAQAKGTTPEIIQREGFLRATGGNVQLLHWGDLPPGWDPATDKRLTYWEATHYLIKAHQGENGGSEAEASELLRKMRGHGETARELAYRLYRTCEAKNWTELALSYNALVVAWPEITRLADAEMPPEQTTLGG
jgi:putative DNA methylase